MITEHGQADHGVEVDCLVCGDRLVEERLDRSIVHADASGWWVCCPECREKIRPEYVRYQLVRTVRILRSVGYDVDLRVDGKEL